MRYTRSSPRKLPARIRTRAVRGEGDDAGRFFRCSYCGFSCDLTRDRLEGDSATAGNNTQIVVTASEVDDSLPRYSGALVYNFTFDSFFGDEDEGGVAVLSGDLNFFHTVTEEAPDGNPKPIYHAFKPKVDYGCPFCGTTNWKGK